MIDDAGDKYCMQNGRYHREDGPAIEFSDGTKEYYLDGKNFSEAAWTLEVFRRHNEEDED